MSGEPERVEAAAICVDGEVWTLPKPARHHVLLQAWSLAHWDNGKPARVPGDHVQGFVTNLGRFVDRTEGERIARAAGQLTKMAGGILTSEDLW